MEGNGRVKYSNFHVTVNLNKDDEAHLPLMREAVENMVDDEWLWVWLKQFDGGSQVDFDENTCTLVENVRLRAAFEHEGKTNRGLHVHIVIEIAHCTMVQISKKGLCDLFRHFCRCNPNVHCRFLKGSGEDKDFILHYITKEVPAYRPESQLNSKLKYAFADKNQQVEAENPFPAK